MDDHLRKLERESVALIREVLSTTDARELACFYSMGKDSQCLLHLLKKASWPDPVPCPLLHIDTGYKFDEMYALREKVSGIHRVVVYRHPDRLDPFRDGPRYTQVMKTEALRLALAEHGVKVAFGGARREEEKSRAKERMVSVRGSGETWDPRNQNAEMPRLWNTMHTADTTLRVFPLSNWTEADIWRYIAAEGIEVVPLYFSHDRAVVERNGQLFATKGPGETRRVRFRTLGCYPLSAAVESEASTVEDIIAEVEDADYTERIGRVIDKEGECAMERKKREGYF